MPASTSPPPGACRAPSEAVAAAAEIGYPVVLKALGQLHKSDSGGVAVGLRDPAELNDALERMQSALDPPSYSVEAMAPLSTGLELIVGAKRDPRFGPILLVGAGGLYAEIVKDVAVALAPVTEAAADALLRSLRVAPLLDGARGRPAVDVGAAARAAAALSRVAAEHPRSPRSRSTRCSPRPTARWGSMPVSSSADARRGHIRREGRHRHGRRIRPRPCDRPRARSPRRRGCRRGAQDRSLWRRHSRS